MVAFSAMVDQMGDADFVLHQAASPPKRKTRLSILENEQNPRIERDAVCHSAWALTELATAQVRRLADFGDAGCQ